MGEAGYNTVIKRNGTSTSFTSESMTATSTTNQYQIDDATKQVWDRTIVPTFYEDGVAIDSSDIDNINYLFGKVTFATSKSGAITVDGSYYPQLTIACGREYTLDQSINLEDSTCYETAQSNNGYMTYNDTLWDVNASVTRLITDMTEYNTFFDIWNNGETVVLEIQPGGGSNPTFRGYMVIETDNETGDVESLEEQEISFMLDDDGNGTGFGWSDY